MIGRTWVESLGSHPFPAIYIKESQACSVLDLFNHVQYMIDDRCILPHSDVENGATSLVPLNIVESAKEFF